MDKYVLPELDEEIKDRQPLFKQTVFRLFRGGALSAPFVITVSFLLSSWGKQVPFVLWTMPITLSVAFSLFVLFHAYYPRNLAFNNRYVRQDSPPEKAKWHWVKKWKLEKSDDYPDWLLPDFHLRFNITFKRKLILEFIKIMVKRIYGNLWKNLARLPRIQRDKCHK